jgi:hypothetical protein
VDLEAHHRWWKQTGCAHVNRILHDDWNPIGVRVPDDEYSTYAGTLGRMLREGRSISEIASFLGSARDRMGLYQEPEDDRADQRIAASLVNWYAGERRDRDAFAAEGAVDGTCAARASDPAPAHPGGRGSATDRTSG